MADITAKVDGDEKFTFSLMCDCHQPRRSGNKVRGGAGERRLLAIREIMTVQQQYDSLDSK
jgi:hypothetical protein